MAAEGYPFPGNLDRRQPTGGLAPPSRRRARPSGTGRGVVVRALASALAAQQAARGRVGGPATGGGIRRCATTPDAPCRLRAGSGRVAVACLPLPPDRPSPAACPARAACHAVRVVRPPSSGHRRSSTGATRVVVAQRLPSQPRHAAGRTRSQWLPWTTSSRPVSPGHRRRGGRRGRPTAETMAVVAVEAMSRACAATVRTAVTTGRALQASTPSPCRRTVGAHRLPVRRTVALRARGGVTSRRGGHGGRRHASGLRRPRRPRLAFDGGGPGSARVV